MKSIIKSKRGFAFPTVLGTFVLVTGLVAGLFIMVMNMTMMVSSDTDRSNDDFSAINRVQVASDFVMANHSMLTHDYDILRALLIDEPMRVVLDEVSDGVWVLWTYADDNENVQNRRIVSSTISMEMPAPIIQEVDSINEIDFSSNGTFKITNLVIDGSFEGTEIKANLIITNNLFIQRNDVIFEGFITIEEGNVEVRRIGGNGNLPANDIRFNHICIVEGDLRIRGNNSSGTATILNGDLIFLGPGEGSQNSSSLVESNNDSCPMPSGNTNNPDTNEAIPRVSSPRVN